MSCVYCAPKSRISTISAFGSRFLVPASWLGIGGRNAGDDGSGGVCMLDVGLLVLVLVHLKPLLGAFGEDGLPRRLAIQPFLRRVEPEKVRYAEPVASGLVAKSVCK